MRAFVYRIKVKIMNLLNEGNISLTESWTILFIE